MRVYTHMSFVGNKALNFDVISNRVKMVRRRCVCIHLFRGKPHFWRRLREGGEDPVQDGDDDHAHGGVVHSVQRQAAHCEQAEHCTWPSLSQKPLSMCVCVCVNT